MNLNHAEKFLLLMQHPKKGRLQFSNINISFGITGIILFDLTNRGIIDLEGKKLKITGSPDSDCPPHLVYTVSLLQNASREHTLRYWVKFLYRNSNKLIKLVRSELEKKHLIRVEKHRFLGIIPYTKTYLISYETQLRLIKDLHDKSLGIRSIESDDYPILAIIAACKLYSLFSRKRSEQKRMAKLLHQKLEDSPISKTVSRSILEIQTAIIAATTSATIAASSGR